jgi:hypothetical protein
MFVRGLRMLLGFRGMLIALYVVVFAMLFGRGAMGFRRTLVVLRRQCVRHLHVDSSRWPAGADQRINGSDRVANKCE